MKISLGRLFIGVLIWALLIGSASAIASESIVPEDGLYTIGVSSNSKMFKVNHCVLHVKDETITAVVTLSGQGYGYLYAGTGLQADAVSQGDWIPFVEDAEGKYTYTLQISSLDQDLDVAAYSTKYSKWYDRVLNFQSVSLQPYDAVPNDGVYAIDVVSDLPLLSAAECILEVRDGAILVQLDLPAAAFEALYLGSQRNAVPVNNGRCTFELASMDKEFTLLLQERAEGALVDHRFYLDSSTLREWTIVKEDGVYSINVFSDSGLFKISGSVLAIEDGNMIASITTDKNTFDYIYPGLAKDARKDEANWIAASADSAGAYTYQLPVSTLDKKVAVATYSAKNKMWYDRTLVFESSTMETIEQ